MSTAIEWTDETWNPVVGCDRVSPGCAHCYAKQLHDMRHRAFLEGKVVAKQYAAPFETVQLKPERLPAPLGWRQPKRVFVNSVADLFHDDVPIEFVAAVWATMALAPRHTFQILTKRPARMLAVLTDSRFYELVLRAADPLRAQRPTLTMIGISNPTRFPLRNVWLGVSVENQRFADERIPVLLDVPAAVRFLSCEPLLGAVDLTRVTRRQHVGGLAVGDIHDALAGTVSDSSGGRVESTPPLPRIDWVIVGGESGKDARPLDLLWLEDLVAQCDFAGVPCFVKQLGSVPMESEAEWRGRTTTRLLNARNHDRVPAGFVPLAGDAKGGDMRYWPERLRVREFPKVRA